MLLEIVRLCYGGNKPVFSRLDQVGSGQQPALVPGPLPLYKNVLKPYLRQFTFFGLNFPFVSRLPYLPYQTPLWQPTTSFEPQLLNFYAFTKIYRDLALHIEAEHHHQEFTLFGISSHTAIAVKFAQRYPQLTQALILMDEPVDFSQADLARIDPEMHKHYLNLLKLDGNAILRTEPSVPTLGVQADTNLEAWFFDKTGIRLEPTEAKQSATLGR